jgi:hypothetical protein
MKNPARVEFGSETRTVSIFPRSIAALPQTRTLVQCYAAHIEEEPVSTKQRPQTYLKVVIPFERLEKALQALEAEKVKEFDHYLYLVRTGDRQDPEWEDFWNGNLNPSLEYYQ